MESIPEKSRSSTRVKPLREVFADRISLMIEKNTSAGNPKSQAPSTKNSNFQQQEALVFIIGIGAFGICDLVLGIFL
jgi:hypothetical protein